MVRLPGYESDPLSDGTSLLREPLFWPVHLLQCGNGDDTLVRPAFEVSADDLWAFYRTVSDPARWPVLGVPVGGGHTVHIVYRNFPDDAGVDYLIGGPGFDAPVPLATVEGHYRGPGLSWPELLVAAGNSTAPAAGASDGEGEGDHDDGGDGDGWTPAQRLVALLPIMADDTLPREALDIVADALIRVGATTTGRVGTVGIVGPTRDLARHILTGQQPWGPVSWRTRHGVRISEDQHAFRRKGGMSDTDLATVSAVLSGGS